MLLFSVNMKEYIYVRFKLAKSSKENVVGFYFDASMNCFRYGINIYNLNAHGMEQIRGKLLEDEQKSLLNRPGKYISCSNKHCDKIVHKSF